MQSYGSQASRNAATASPAPQAQQPGPQVPALFKSGALQGVGLPTDSPQAQHGEYCKPVQGFTSSQLMPGKV